MARSDATISIAIDDVMALPGRRALNRDAVRNLAASIKEIGLQSPIMVRNVEGEELYVLVSGGHRLEAFRSLGIDRIPARIVEFDDLRAELWEIDENLCRSELTATERAVQTARRQAIYEKIHGKAKAKGAHAANAAMGNDHNTTAKLADAFTTDTAKSTGRSERATQRDVERGLAICPEAAALIGGTFLDKGKYLDALKSLSHEEQVLKVRADLVAPIPEKKTRAPKSPKRSANPADAALKQPEVLAPNSPAPPPQTSPISALMSAWMLSSNSERAAFLAEIGASLVNPDGGAVAP